VPLYCVTEDLKCGALREILSRFPIPVHPLSLVFCPGKTNAAKKFRSLGDFLRRLVFANSQSPNHRREIYMFSLAEAKRNPGRRHWYYPVGVEQATFDIQPRRRRSRISFSAYLSPWTNCA